MAIVCVIAILGVGATAWLLTDRLVDQTTKVATSTGEVLIATQQISASFAEADTAAVSVHLAGADGNREQRRLYESAIERATTSLELVARLVGDDEPSHGALATVAARTTEYTGLIEAARLASVEDLDNADTLLRSASAVNRDEISPDVQIVARRALARFDEQTSSDWYSIAIILLVVALSILVGAQYVLSRRFRRIFNVPLVLASLVIIVLVALSARAFTNQREALNAAQEQGFDAILVSGQIQQTAYRHRALGTSSVLTNQEASSELAELEDSLADGAGAGLLAQAKLGASSDRERAGADEVIARWTRYVDESSRIERALQRGETSVAEQITQGSANAAFNGFNTSVEAALLDNREQFLGQLSNAQDSLRWRRGVILFGSLLAALLTWWGFAIRIGEYR